MPSLMDEETTSPAPESNLPTAVVSSEYSTAARDVLFYFGDISLDSVHASCSSNRIIILGSFLPTNCVAKVPSALPSRFSSNTPSSAIIEKGQDNFPSFPPSNETEDLSMSPSQAIITSTFDAVVAYCHRLCISVDKGYQTLSYYICSFLIIAFFSPIK